MADFVAGHCYRRVGETKVYICKKSLLLRAAVLVPYSGLLKTPIVADSVPGGWVDCTDAVRKRAAIQNFCNCTPESISSSHVGSVITFEEEGRMSDPHLLFAYQDGIAYLMTMDGKDKVYNLKLSQCYPIQKAYKEIADRATSDDPLLSSRFDSLLHWLKKTDRYRSFTELVRSVEGDDREDMIRLFELMSLDGVESNRFEEEVDKRYAMISESERKQYSRYTAVLNHYDSPARKYNKMEAKVMRLAIPGEKTPQEVWNRIGQGKPFPTTWREMVDMPSYTVPKTLFKENPQVYVAEALGLYMTGPAAFWVSLCRTIGAWLDMDEKYKEGCSRYLALFPEFNMKELNFIREEDKESVFKKVLGVDKLDEKDPYRAWMKNPPEKFKRLKMENPTLSYPAIFLKTYREGAY